MPRYLYTLLLYLLLPLLLLRQAWRGRGLADARGSLSARLGRVEKTAGRPVWLHCVSVGETVAAEPLVAALLASGMPLLLSSTTFTGAARVRARFGQRVARCYMPYDTPAAVARFLTRVQPRLLVIMETELWPNLLHACHQRGIPVLLVNARLSARSARGYARVSALTAPMLQNLSAVAAQTQADASRFLSLGLPPERLHVTGNLKFDLDADPLAQQDARVLRERLAARPVWVAASTHEGEDEIVLAAHRQVLRDFPDALLVLVPRHPERFAQVLALVLRRGFACEQRSEAGFPASDVQVYLGDTMGEMLLFFGAADVAFVGGSFVPVGGHNFLEPAALGLPMLSGPHCFNFQAIADDLVAAGALWQVTDADALAQAVSRLLGDERQRAVAGASARAYVGKNRGACQRTMALIMSALTDDVSKK